MSNLSQFYKNYRFQILLVFGLRIGYSLWLGIFWFFIDKYFPLSEQALWETYYHLSRSPSLIGRAFIDVWLRWDAVHYMNIAEFGYEGVGLGDTVFFPLYPYLVGGLSRMISFNVTLVGIIVSSIATLFASIFFYELVNELFNDKRLAKWSTACLVLYPTAFFLHAPYTDALFLVTSIASILMMVRKKPIMAGLFACAAGLTRAQGVLLLIPMVIILFQDHIHNKKFINWGELVGLIITPLGFGAYSFYRMKIGVAGFLETYQTHSNVDFQFPLTNIYIGINGILNRPTILEISELISVLLFLALLIWMVTQKKFCKHIAIMAYSISTWLIITSKITLWASPFQCSNRYILHIFFAFVGMAALLLKLSYRKQKFVILFSIISGLILITMYGLWLFIG
ncbi:MAG: mannosyltransferase family protein [Anaerolineaceae bacterium]|nr:mannosyltransferase family protein [Anaerolineaceae bacterium]